MLKLKTEYEGIIISRTKPGMGSIVFDYYKVKPEHYPNFINQGFDFLFDDVDDKLNKKKRKNSVSKKITQKKGDLETAKKQVKDYASKKEKK